MWRCHTCLYQTAACNNDHNLAAMVTTSWICVGESHHFLSSLWSDSPVTTPLLGCLAYNPPPTPHDFSEQLWRHYGSASLRTEYESFLCYNHGEYFSHSQDILVDKSPPKNGTFAIVCLAVFREAFRQVYEYFWSWKREAGCLNMLLAYLWQSLCHLYIESPGTDPGWGVDWVASHPTLGVQCP